MNNIYDYLKTQNFPDNFIVVECGGHIGNDTVKLAEYFKNGTIYSVEANKILYDKHLIGLNKSNVKVYNMALADKCGEMTFYIDCNKDGDMGASSLLESSESYLKNHIHEENKITVKCTRLEDFMKNNKIDKIDLLWLDMEGYEYYLLKDSESILNKISYIYTEVNFQEFRKNGKLYSDIKNILSNNFIEIARWEQGDKWTKWQGNVLFKNKGYNNIDKYKYYLDNGIRYYYPDDVFIKFYKRVPLSRYYSFKYCLDYLNKFKNVIIVELGTSRSYVDGRFVGCNSDDKKYWEPNDMTKWDWSAGCFTRVFADLIGNQGIINTVDMAKGHIERCKFMNKEFNNIKYFISSSEEFLKSYNGKIDLLYMDTGDMTPIEPTIDLQLREAKIIVERNLISDNGLILIDDIRNPTSLMNGNKSELGKGQLAIPYLLKNGFKIVFDEYQVILVRSSCSLI
jgi:FkbM family methyltransferase